MKSDLPEIINSSLKTLVIGSGGLPKLPLDETPRLPGQSRSAGPCPHAAREDMPSSAWRPFLEKQFSHMSGWTLGAHFYLESEEPILNSPKKEGYIQPFSSPLHVQSWEQLDFLRLTVYGKLLSMPASHFISMPF